MTPIERFEAAVASYMSEIRFTGKSNATIGNYERRLRYFENFWQQSGPKKDPGRDDIRAYRDYLLAKGTSPQTVKQYLIELRTFFEFCVDDEIYDMNPVTKKIIPKVKDSKQYDKILDSEKLALLWENTGTGRNWARNYAIVVLLLDGKVRNSELRDMKLKDIDFKFSEVTIPKGKGNKSRTVSLTDISLSAIQLYLASGIRPASCTDDDYLFGTKTAAGQWRRGTAAWLSELVEKHVLKVTGISGFRPHSLRHNGTIFDLNRGISMERLQAELGHSSVTTTEIYAGRLGSKRHQAGFKMAICSRDYWAEKNKAILAENLLKAA